MSKHQGLYTSPELSCEACGNATKIPPSNKAFLINRKIIFATKCVGGTGASLSSFCSLLDIPGPVSQSAYKEHAKVINDHCIAQAQASMQRARKEVHDCYGVPYDDIVDVTVSSDGTWQCHGFSSLFGAMFVIEHETKKFFGLHSTLQILSRLQVLGGL